MATTRLLDTCPVAVTAGKLILEGDLCVPPAASSLVVFAHSSGSSRHNSRNQYIAQVLRKSGLATLLFDLLTDEEEKNDLKTGRYRFDIRTLANRLVGTTEWLKQNAETRDMSIGYFGTGNGAAAALVAAAEHPADIGAVVSRGGRPDLALTALPYVKAPTLLIVSGRDLPVMAINRDAFAELRTDKKTIVIPGVTHLEQPEALEEVAREATNWFGNYLNRKLPYSPGITTAG